MFRANKQVRGFSFLQHNWVVFFLLNREMWKHREVFRGRVLDLGCGLQPYRSFIESLGATYVGVDWGQSIHDVHPDILADLNGPLAIPSHVADSLLSISVAEHLKEPETFIREAFRILAPGGAFFLEVPFQWHVHEAPHDYFRFTRYGLEHLFTKAGFQDLETRAITGFWTLLGLKLNYQTLRFIRGPQPLRWLIRTLLGPFWFLGQVLALALDRLDWSEADTASYTVLARKPSRTGVEPTSGQPDHVPDRFPRVADQP